MNTSLVKELLTEKLRPKTFKNVILLNRVRRLFPDGQLTQNVLFAGSAGMGKTSFGKILASDYPTLYINVSADRGIDTVRQTIVDFASTKSLEPGKKDDFKVVILDELDGATDALFKALRATMEKFANTTRFIATCNYINRIPDPIQSRFSVVNFDPQNLEEEQQLKKMYSDRVLQVTDKLNIKWETTDLMNKFVDRNFPDLRKIFSIIQDIKNSGVEMIKEDDLSKKQYQYIDLYKLICSKSAPDENYKFLLSNFSGKSDDIFMDLINEFPIWFLENHKHKESKLPQILISICNWDFKRKSLIDENAGLLACVFESQVYFNS